jgi:hypothetical protein
VPDLDEPSPWKRLWWAGPAAVVLLLALAGMMGIGRPQPSATSGSSYDASPHGIRAAYLLLEGLGYDVAASRRLAVGKVRWMLFPRPSLLESARRRRLVEDDAGPSVVNEGDMLALRRWVESGGTLLVAEDGRQFAEQLGVRVETFERPGNLEIDLLGDKRTVSGGSIDVVLTDQPDSVWPPTGEPLASIFRKGKGSVWIVHRPGFVLNEHLREADNAIVLCRLADATAGGERIHFDEFFHGLRERPGVAELLLKPPALWVTLQALIVLGLVLWRALPPFGAVRGLPPVRRRSKEEYLDAMANLLAMKGAYREAHAAVRDALTRDLTTTLGIPPATAPEVVAAEAARRRPGIDPDRLAQALGRTTPPHDVGDFLRAICELDALRHEFFHERHHRQAV